MTLGGRIEDVFSINGEALRYEEVVIAIEGELLEVLADARFSSKIVCFKMPTRLTLRQTRTN